MPQRMWKIICGCSSGWVGRPDCDLCRQPNEYVGWSYGMYERMAIYQYRYGVRPIGPHRKLADEMIGPHIRRCEQCNGEGLLTDFATNTWEWCHACEATGSTVDCDSETLRRIHEHIEADFPGAVVTSPVHPFKRAVQMLDLSTGEIVGPQEQDH
jgi:hypothetical protein